MLLALPRIVLAGVSSGVGKTTMTTAFIAHLRTRGITVQPFKIGPDYIDPSHLTCAASQPCSNLDTWMMPPSRMLDVFCAAAASADIAGIEGMMGWYDGQSSTSKRRILKTHLLKIISYHVSIVGARLYSFCSISLP